MLRKLFRLCLTLPLLALFLTACSGGGALTEGEGGGTGGSGADDDQIAVASIMLQGQTIVPVDGETTITVTALDSGDNNVGNAPLAISAGGAAALGNIPASTSINGQATFTVTNKVAEAVTVTVGSGTVSESIILYFGASVATTMQGNYLPANGTASANLLVKVQDHLGVPIEGMPVTLSFSQGSFATPSISQGNTDANGTFTTSITDTVKETVTVTPIVGGMRTRSFELVFTASELTAPTSVELIITDNNILADGQASASLRVIARDDGNTPISNVPVSLSSNSPTAVVSPISGDTGEGAVFEATVSNTVPEAVEIVAIAGGVQSEPKVVYFSTEAGPQVETINVSLNQYTALANGSDSIMMTIYAKDAAGQPVVGAPVSFLLDRGSAQFNPESGETDTLGRFMVNVTDEVVEGITVTPKVSNKLGPITVLRFVAEAVDPGEDPPQVATLTLTVANDNQPADGSSAITLSVVPRDPLGTPLAGVEVAFSSTSGSAQFSAATGTTNSGGNFTATVTNTVPGSFNVAAMAGGRVDAKTVTFKPIGAVDVSTVVATVTDNGQLADGQSAATLTVVARDAQSRPVQGAPVSLIFNPNQQGEPSRAVPAQGSGETNSGGSFTTTITDTFAESFTVTPVVSGVPGNSVELRFVASSATTPPAYIDLTADRDSVPADGSSGIRLTVVARDADDAPLQNVEIKLTTSSGSALLTPASGNTGNNGAFISTVTNTVAESVRITASPSSGAPLDELNLTFTEVAGSEPASVHLNLSNNGAVADGQAEVVLTTVVRDADGTPIQGVPVRLTSDSLVALFNSTTGATGTTNAGGVFTTSMTSTKPESFVVTPSAGGLTGEPVEISFTEATSQQPESLRLIADSTQLGSEGTAEGVLVTALLTTAGNNPFPGATVNFTASSGVIQPIEVTGGVAPGVTNDAGIAQARLTTSGNPANREITVTARSPDVPSDSVVIQVSGTEISISGPEVITSGSQSDPSFTILLKDSSGGGIPNKTLEVSTTSGTISNANPVTDANGQVTVTLTPQNSGTLEVSWPEGNVQASHEFTVSQTTLSVEPVDASGNPLLDPNGVPYTLENLPDTPLGESRHFKVAWSEGPTVNVSATRGGLTPADGVVSINPVAGGTFQVSSNDAGVTTVTVTGVLSDGSQGPSIQFNFDFVATRAVNMSLQAEPATIGINTAGNNSEQSQIIAVVRDANNNLVKNSRVEFTLQDVSGGRIEPSFAYTDRNGRATTSYIAGSTPSGADGVRVTATAFSPVLPDRAPDPSTAGPNTVALTVARRSVFIAMGTGNEISEPNTTTYVKDYSVYVTDINGVAMEGADIFISAIPRHYHKGFHVWSEDAEVWVALKGAEYPENPNDPNSPMITIGVANCLSEDLVHQGNPANQDFVKNGILDPGEDINGNNKLDPGNVVVVPSSVTTDANGFAEFKVTYAQEYAHWAAVDIVARAVVAGTEGQKSVLYELQGIATDYNQKDVPPPGSVSPFGYADSCNDPT